MGGLFGGGQNVSISAPIITSIRIQTSTFGRAVPLVYGKARVSGNLLWYRDFTAIPHTTTQSSGGKGGGGGGSTTQTTYTYSVAAIMGLCEGQIQGVVAVWADKSQHTLAELGMSVFNGSAAQGPFTYAETNYPDEALGYRRLAYVASGAYDLGDSASLPNHTFEIEGLLPFSSSIRDANPADVLADYLAHPIHGVGFPSAKIGDLTAFSAYCVASGIFTSPAYTDQAQANEHMTRLAQIANAALVYSEGVLKVIPYGDTPITGNGATYAPNTTPVYALTDDDFLASDGDDPVIVLRGNPADAYNQVQVKFYNRANQYNDDIAEAKDQSSIELYGLRPMQPVELREICDPDVARSVAQLILQRSLYIRNTYRFKLGLKFALLEPMDIVTLTESSGTGLSNVPVRITLVEEDENGDLSLEAEDFPGTVSSHVLYPSQQTGGYIANYNIAPGSVTAPLIFDAPSRMAPTGFEVWAAVASAGVFWGGANVWVSTDNATFKQVGAIYGRSRYGTLTAPLPVAADPDLVHTCAVDLTISQGELLGGSRADANNLLTLSYVDGELIAFESATLTAANHYALGTCLRRGVYGTAITDHAAGAPFARIDDALFRYAYDAGLVGQQIWLKFQSFNIYGGALEDLSGVIAYSYTIGGPLGAPASVTGFTASVSGREVQLAWSSVSDLDLAEYEIREGGTDWATATLVAKVRATSFALTPETAGLHTWRIRAVDAAGNTSAQDATAALTIAGPSVVSVSAAITGPSFRLTWSESTSDFPIEAYEIRYGATYAGSVLLDRVRALSYSGTPDWTGSRTFWVSAIDSAGYASTAVSTVLSIDGPSDASVAVDALGNAVISFKQYNDPQILKYELRVGTSFETGTVVASTTGSSFTLPLLGSAGNTYWIKAVYPTGYSVLGYKIDFSGTQLAAPADLSWRISEPDMVFYWTAVPGASQYLALFEDGGVTSVKTVTAPEVSFHIPKWTDAVFRVIAIASNGALSKFVDEVISVTGQYNLNEIVNISVPVTTGNYINLCFTAANQVIRASLLGVTPAAPYAQNINDGDLYTFGYNLAGVVANNFASTPASWFRDDFWLVKNGYFESAVVDLGAVLSGRLSLNLTKNITFVGDSAVSAYAQVLSEYMASSTPGELTDQRAFLSARFMVAADSPNSGNWVEYNNGDWITAGRYVKIVVEVAMASPLTDITVTSGFITLDVPDVTESGSKTGVTSAGVAVTFTKTFNQVNVVIATARGAAKAYTGSITKTGCTLYVDTGTQQVDYFVKGY